MNNIFKTVVFFSLMVTISLAQTTRRYHETFTTNNELGWAFVGDGSIGI